MVAVLWLTLSAVRVAPAWAVVPAVSAPVGSAWLLPVLDPTLARAAQIGIFGGAVLGLVGVYARVGFTVVTICGFYLLAIPQFHGGVQHYHHLLWFAALLAASPCSDALAVGQWRPVAGRSAGWGVPTRVAWALLAVIYFFPGVHKVRVQGLDWAGDNLTYLMYWKWAQNWDFTPLSRLDHWPTVLWAGGVAVLCFELAAPLLVVHRWSRLGFVVLAGLFHLGTALWFDIQFWVLWACFIVMWPFAEAGSEQVSRDYRPALAMGALLVTGVVATGVTNTTQGWPFACYPTFEQPVDRWMPTVVLVGVDSEGQTHLLSERLLADPEHSQAFYSEAWGLSGLYGHRSAAAVDHFWGRVQQRVEVREALDGDVRVRVVAARRSVVPDDPAVELGVVLGEYPAPGAQLEP